jgi:HPt (histidine-containing phosphotransfer) domain-containing protein
MTSDITPVSSVALVARLPLRPHQTDVAVVENELRELLRAARAELAQLLSYVLAERVLEPSHRESLYAGRIAIQQRIDAVRWRSADDLAATAHANAAVLATAGLQRLAAITRELADQCDAIERDANKAWAHLASIFTNIPPLP